MKTTITIIITTIVVCFATLWWCGETISPGVIVSEITTIDTVYVRDTITISTPIPTEVTFPSETIEIPSNTDTLVEYYKRLYSELNTRKVYMEKYNLDTLGSITVRSVLFRNSIDTQTIMSNLTIPVTRISTKIYTQQCNIYAGVAMLDRNIIPTILYTRPRISILSGYNINTKQPLFGVGYRIFGHEKRAKNKYHD